MDILPKFLQLLTEIENLKTEDGPLLSKNTEEFLNLSHEQIKDARWLKEANLLEDSYNAKEKILHFKQRIKTTFLKQLKNKVKKALKS